MLKYKSEIVICEFCNGEGFQSRHEITDYHRGEYDVVTWECSHCDGKGRLKKRTTMEFEKL